MRETISKRDLLRRVKAEPLGAVNVHSGSFTESEGVNYWTNKRMYQRRYSPQTKRHDLYGDLSSKIWGPVEDTLDQIDSRLRQNALR